MDNGTSEPVVGRIEFGPAETLPPRPQRPAQPYIAVLVDYDNVAWDEISKETSISFARLLDYLRQSGTIVLAQAYLSPTATQLSIITSLTQAGLEAVACPMETKNRDAVDTLIKFRAYSLLSAGLVDTVVIVSRDSDFRDLVPRAANLGREVRLVNVLDILPHIIGTDAVVDPMPERETRPFADAIAKLRSGIKPGTRKGEGPAQLLKHIVRILYARENGRYRAQRLGFKALVSYVHDHLNAGWQTDEHRGQITHALTALVNANILFRREYDSRDFTYYTLNGNDPVIRTVLKL